MEITVNSKSVENEIWGNVTALSLCSCSSHNRPEEERKEDTYLQPLNTTKYWWFSLCHYVRETVLKHNPNLVVKGPCEPDLTEQCTGDLGKGLKRIFN